MAAGAEKAEEGTKRKRETEGGCSPPKRGRTGAGAGALKQGRGTKRKRDVDPAGGGEDREMPSDGGSGGHMAELFMGRPAAQPAMEGPLLGLPYPMMMVLMDLEASRL